MLSVYEMMKEILILRRKVKLLEEGGGGGTHGIDDVLAVGQDLTADRGIVLNGNAFTIFEGTTELLKISPTPNNESASLLARNITDDDNEAGINLGTTDTQANVFLGVGFNGYANEASISGSANVSSATLTYSAYTHTFDGLVGIGGTPTSGNMLDVKSEDTSIFLATQYGIGSNTSQAGSTASLTVTADATNVRGLIALSDGIGSGGLFMHSDSDDGYTFSLESGDGTNSISISGNAVSNAIDYVADTHTFNGSVVMMGDLPTGDPNNPGQLWNDGGTLKISTL